MNPYEAANVVNETFTHGGILLERTEFQKVMVFQNDGRTNLLFPFFQVKLEMGKTERFPVLPEGAANHFL